METLDHRRRRGGVSGDLQGLESGGPPSEVEAALSQSLNSSQDASSVPAMAREAVGGGTRHHLEASPGTLERGQGSSSLTASPFHSEKVRSEVELLNRRPRTLDADARKAITGKDVHVEGGHPFPEIGAGARVARVETREGESLHGTSTGTSPRWTTGEPGEASRGQVQAPRVFPEEPRTPREDGG